MLSVLATFFGVLLVVMYAVGVTMSGSLKGPDAFWLRWTIIAGAVAFSGFAAWLRWLIVRRRQRKASVWGETKPRAPMAVSPVARAPAPPPSRPSAEATAILAAAARQSIVFRQHMPPRHDRAALSFFGGAPVAPRGFVWPRGNVKPGSAPQPLSFIMQIDCAAVPPPARLGLPDNGVLYFFLDLRWGEGGGFRVLHEAGPIGDWTDANVPDDLGTAFGNESVYLWKWTRSVDECPKLLPKWSFDPVVIAVPVPPRDQDDDPDSPFLWPGENAVTQALQDAQGEDVMSMPFSVKNLSGPGGTLLRPFDSYPQDWQAIRIASGVILKEASGKRLLQQRWLLKDMPEDRRAAIVAELKDEAQQWFDRAAGQSPHAAVPQPDCDAFWSWLVQREPLVLLLLSDAITLSVEASLTASAEAASRVPPDAMQRVHARHALAVRTDRGPHVNTPDRMLGPPADVQGNQYERAQTDLLLFEMSSNEGLGHHFGEGVYQFWIRPEDLKAGRFDRVELTTDAY